MNIDVELKRIDKNKISEITILKNEGKISHQRNDVIILQYAFKLSKKAIKETLIEINTKFTDKYHGSSQHIYTDANDTVLHSNQNKIHHTDIKIKLHNSTVNNID